MRLKIAGALIILVVVLSCATPEKSNELRPRDSPVQVGETAPNFTLEDQNNQKVALSSTRGTPTVLVFYRGHW